MEEYLMLHAFSTFRIRNYPCACISVVMMTIPCLCSEAVMEGGYLPVLGWLICSRCEQCLSVPMKI